jgi:hypothetical protein
LFFQSVIALLSVGAKQLVGVSFRQMGIPDDGDHRFRAIVIAVPG